MVTRNYRDELKNSYTFHSITSQGEVYEKIVKVNDKYYIERKVIPHQTKCISNGTGTP